VKLRFTYRATTDLQRLRAFIAKDNPLAARSKIDALRRSIRHLIDQPHIGRPIDEASGMRQWVAGDYVVRYFLDDHFLTVIRIWHGKEHRSDY
jgi:addiction module RelE/StbE family toxin